MQQEAITLDWRTTFAGRQIEVSGLSDVADKLICGQSLEESDAELLRTVSLPLLGKLIEWQEIEFTELAGAEGGNFEQSLLPWDESCAELFALRTRLTPQEPARWILRLPSPLDGLTESLSGATDFAKDPTGVEVLRILSLARLILPPEVEVSALASELGEKVACVASSFGVVVQPATSDKVTL